ncbi:MAG: glycosyl hydrolase family 28-related protein [Rhodomicrobium sp.]
MDRRYFMGLSGTAAALFGASAAEAAPPATALSGRTVLDFGVAPDSPHDQSDAMQKAIDELSASRQPIAIPAGNYRLEKLVLPSNATVLGVPGLSVLTAPGKAPIFETAGRDVSFRGVTFSGLGLLALDCRNLSICDCQVLSSAGDGIVCVGTGLYIAGNRAASCAKAAISAGGDGIVTNNLVTGPGQFGLRLGGPTWLGTLTVMNNRIEGTAVGIGVSNADKGYALIAMNMIIGAKNGGIRAFMGEELIGKDLTHGGSEAFRNLAVLANVSL